MELKVWVEGIQRIVCGVTEATTCQDIVFALAHATGKSGRFTLIERWRNNERQLAPNEHPMKIQMKWGEYSNDVQFILQWTESKSSNNKQPKLSSPTSTMHIPNKIVVNTSEREKSPTSTGQDNVGVVKGIPQVRPVSLEVRETFMEPKKDLVHTEQLDSSQRVAPPYKEPPAPPPYRDPPPPSAATNKHIKNTNDESDMRKYSRLEEAVLYNAQYRELVSLVNFQREKLSSQQVDLTKFDAEIVFWESKEREKQFQLDFLSQEFATMTNASRSNSEQIHALNYVEEESDLVKQQEKTLKSEITLLRSKLANCETELLQCKNKIRLIMDELHIEQRVLARKNEARKQLERNLLAEVERLQSDIEVAKQSTEAHQSTADTLKREVAALEAAIIDKKKQVEHLVSEMKEANLESLLIAPQDELKHLFEGPNRAGSTRKIIGSPRQLENAVATNKNPHGVWV